MNGASSLEILKNKFELHTAVHGCHAFMQAGATKIVSVSLKKKIARSFDWPGNSTDLNPIDNL